MPAHRADIENKIGNQPVSTGQKRRRWPRVLAGIASCLVLVVTGVAAVGAYYAQGLAANITSGTDGNFTSEKFQPTPGAPINILLMGSDTRQGANGKGYGSASTIQGARSDTTILLHISGDRTRALAVSIPRDSKVQLPICKAISGGGTGGGDITRFNEAFDIGGPGCTVKTVESLTGVEVDHYVVVDFAGFKDIVNALDGVEVCLAKPVVDEQAKLDLRAGRQVVRGEDALAFVRARKALSDGTDIARIERQQDFLSSAIRKATSMDVVSNPKKLYEVLSAGTKSLTTDPGLANFDSIKELALEVSAVRPSNVTFATVPFTYNDDGGTVSWDQAQANELWSAIKTDTPWPPQPTNGTDGQPLTAAPAAVVVNVENGTGVNGEARRAADLLTANGYKVGAIQDAKSNGPSAISYNPAVPGQVAAARTLEVATGLTATPTSKNPGPAVTLVIGSDFSYSLNAVRVVTAPTAAVEAAKPRDATKSVCAS